MKSYKKILIGLSILLAILAVVNYKLIDYGISQAKGQLKIINGAKPVSDWLQDDNYPDSLKEKLRLVSEIKQYAFDSLGINYSENYSTMFDQKGQPSMFVVSASEPFKLEPVEFKFPIIGSFSYKGFFEQERAEKLEQQLKSKGLDTNIRTAGGWSTLGWFKDPILSNMLNRGEGDLAETIIHELTHGTLFVKDSLKFNENLATFIGSHGARLFLKQHFGEHSDEYREYMAHWHDRRKYVSHLLRGAKYLDSLYHTFPAGMEQKKKEQLKSEAIGSIVENLDTLGLNNVERYKKYLEKRGVNNTLFMSYLRYNGDIERLEKELQQKYGGDIKTMLGDYKSKYSSL